MLVSDLIRVSNRALTLFRKASDHWSSVGTDESPACGVPQTDFILGFSGARRPISSVQRTQDSSIPIRLTKAQVGE